MKKLLVLLSLGLGISAQAQFTLEQTYDTAATWNMCQGNASQFLMVNLEQSGERYIKINRCAKHIKLYNLNHALTKTVYLPNIPLEPTYNTVGDFLYFSENLFNTDAKLEFMYVVSTGSFYATYVFNEDAVQLFFENGVALVKPAYHMQQYPIYNTTQGTKLILSYINGQAKVFGLGGTLTTAIQTHGPDGTVPGSALSAAMPNPSSSQSRIDYSLPKGINEGTVVFYNIEGKEIKRFNVDNSFDHLLLSTSDLAAGTYFYRLETSGNSSEAKKLVVIH
jgi:hypothetical protein